MKLKGVYIRILISVCFFVFLIYKMDIELSLLPKRTTMIKENKEKNEYNDDCYDDVPILTSENVIEWYKDNDGSFKEFYAFEGWQNDEKVSIVDTDIDYYRAMDIYSSKREVVVAVLDTGVSSELFNNSQIVCEYNLIDKSSDIDEEGLSHGNAMLSILIKNNFNNQITGMLEKTSSSIMLLKVIDSESGRGNISNIIEAILYAEDNGAKICCMAFDLYSYDMELHECMRNSNMLFVVPAGNDGMLLGDEFCTYPAGYNLDNVLVCSDIRADGEISLTSNYGVDYVDVAVPGTDIPVVLKKQMTSCISGTSVATAIATGVAAIAYSDAEDVLVAKELKDLIIRNVSYSEKLEDKVFSKGVINLYDVLSNN